MRRESVAIRKETEPEKSRILYTKSMLAAALIAQ
jgi:hypothetical protein